MCYCPRADTLKQPEKVDADFTNSIVIRVNLRK
jgi:hypothetical protein